MHPEAEHEKDASVPERSGGAEAFQREQPVRTFIAVPLPPELRQATARVTEGLKTREADVKWVPAENLHFTLKFLGEVPASQVESIAEGIAAALAGTGSFPVTLRGAGAFPKPDRPQVLWIGVTEGHEPLRALAERIEESLAALGFPRERRPFAAHLTLGRLRSERGAGSLSPRIRAAQDQEVGGFLVERVVLMKSELRPAGPIYTALKEFSLGE